MEQEEKCCGNCCWFYLEQTNGEGFCIQQKKEWDDGMLCDDVCQDMGKGIRYVSRQEMRHYIAVLIQANRYRRDQSVPPVYRMPNPTELGKAIEFAVEYIKAFSEL